MRLKSEWFASSEVAASFGEEFDIQELEDFFSDIFNLFTEESSGSTLLDYISNDWHLFKNGVDVQSILQEASSLCSSSISFDTHVRYSDDVMSVVNGWNDIKNELRNNRRFLMDDFIKNQDNNWEWIFSNNERLMTGDKYYRGRINIQIDSPFETENEMSAPPRDKANPGRVNPYGIPHLYLTDSAETAMYELRAVSGDQLTIAMFEITEDIDIIDFTKHEDLYNMYSGDYDSLLQAVQRWALLKEVSKDLSKPIRRYDNAELDYLPTQLVCEYIRVKKGLGGLVFQSSRTGLGHKNIVIFDKNKAHMVSSQLKTVGNVQMSFE
ncbi:MAG: RES family NAD+ phosphorylase [Candidatus Cryptobacteroides sp.]|nr:RES family NAD+ phosphorylase [Candidatus Cryptobacteroides sp.]